MISTLNQSRKQFKWRVPADVGFANGFTSDLCTTKDINGEVGKTCFASPNQGLNKREIQEKERLYNEQKAAANPSMAARKRIIIMQEVQLERIQPHVSSTD